MVQVAQLNERLGTGKILAIIIDGTARVDGLLGIGTLLGGDFAGKGYANGTDQRYAERKLERSPHPNITCGYLTTSASKNVDSEPRICGQASASASKDGRLISVLRLFYKCRNYSRADN